MTLSLTRTWAFTGNRRVEQQFYVSVDSAPVRYTDIRDRRAVPMFLAVLVLLSWPVARVEHSLAPVYASLLSVISGAEQAEILRPGYGLSVRPLVLLFLLVLGAFGNGTVRERLHFSARAVITYGLAALLSDTLILDNRGISIASPLSQRGGVVAVVVGLAVISWLVLTSYRLPEDVTVRPLRTRHQVSTVIVAAAVIAGVAAATLLSTDVRRLASTDTPLVNGYTSAVVCFVTLTALTLFVTSQAVGVWLHRRSPQPGDRGMGASSLESLPTVAFLVPAHNEQGSVSAVIRALDKAAAQYGGRCRVVVVNNLSSDNTVNEARSALATCQWMTGEVIECDVPGKAHALNEGLAIIGEDLVVRVDADTIVESSLVTRLVHHFQDPSTGGVSGLPLPRSDTRRWLYPVRLMEVLYAVGFLRVGQGAIDAVLVMPGNMSAYRAEALRRLDGFGVGFNGEDTDIAIRIGRLGYKVVTDLGLRFYTEVPATLHHLREQRLRWSRGTFHVTARNLSCIRGLQGARGLMTLPWSYVNACRRSVMLPLLLAAGVAGYVSPGLVSLRQVAVIGGILLGLHLVTVAMLLVAHGQARLLPWLPVYFVFRVYKLYIAFEALLTLRLRAPEVAET